MAYPVTVDAINTVFSPYGFVQKIAIFEKNNGWQVRQGSSIAAVGRATHHTALSKDPPQCSCRLLPGSLTLDNGRRPDVDCEVSWVLFML